MAGTNSPSDFGFDDFRRYYHGEMSAQEQHNLEKRMLEEPLVARAYEGFLALNEDQIDHTSALEELRETLKEKIKPKRNKVLPIWAYASAAAVVLSLGFYWLVGLNKKAGSQDVASMIIEKPDQVSAAGKPKPEEAPSAPTALKPLPQKALGNVPATKTEPEPSESIDLPRKEEKPLDTNLEEAIAAYDYDEQISIVESIPASAPAAAFESREPIRKSASKVSKEYVASVTSTSLSSRPAPLIGWGSYQSYLSKNSDSADLTGEVEVTFRVNADSTLSAFSPKGDARLFQKAIRTIRYGPVWIPARPNGQPIGMPATVRIQFRNSN